ncbi:hypothetical protein HRG_008154 [Hirsutella rhossiliensis]|uniref:Uncharacterized protein n=1 Tax=Hirsutella rhossiliensis TaxID=111463 RepID=A0A9P8MVH9_9HYPO|nr:uncharacterized protein HRG_08154 [Hirsutella rhossiliensis]KAH0961001.1 hypothetical protein HRG_08154 [Hirsutella rhossiliensis]
MRAPQVAFMSTYPDGAKDLDVADQHQKLADIRAHLSMTPLDDAPETGKKPPVSGGTDSGYVSLTSSHEAQLVGLDRLDANLKYFNKPIPARLNERFFDFKVLYTQPLIDEVSRKWSKPGDISMKLKYLGSSTETAQLHIVLQCRKEVSKTVKKFFAQQHVVDDLEPDFRVFVLGKELLRLAAGDVHVLTDSWHEQTFCGMPINMTRYAASVAATFGGLIMVETLDTSEKRLYGLTAGHPLGRLNNDSPSSIPEAHQESDSDSDVPDDDCELRPFDSINIEQNPWLEADFEGQSGELIRDTNIIGTIVEDKLSTQENYDWAIIDLASQNVPPNALVLDGGLLLSANSPRRQQGIEAAITLFTSSRQPEFSSKPVVVLSRHGPQTGVLTWSSSCLMIAPGSKFVSTYDLIMESVSRLSPGDSGSWVVSESTGEVYGHVVSMDAFGEAQVMPIQATLESIRTQLDASRVFLPTLKDIQSATLGWPRPPAPQPAETSCSGENGEPGILTSTIFKEQGGSSLPEAQAGSISCGSSTQLNVADIAELLQQVARSRKSGSMLLLSGHEASGSFAAPFTPKPYYAPSLILSEPRNPTQRHKSEQDAASVASSTSLSDIFDTSDGIFNTSGVPVTDPSSASEPALHQPVDASPSLLPCEFSNSTGCGARFALNQIDLWIEHGQYGHLQGHLPSCFSCWFCDDVQFRAARPADKHLAYRDRMLHIANHFLQGMTTDLVHWDFHLLHHAHKHGLISQTAFRTWSSQNQPPMPRGMTDAVTSVNPHAVKTRSTVIVPTRLEG